MVWVSLFIGGQKSPFITFVGAPPLWDIFKELQVGEGRHRLGLIRWQAAMPEIYED